MRRPRKPRKPRARQVAKAIETLQRAGSPADLIDKHTGAPNGENILRALSALATGTPDEIAKVFGGYLRMRARDRQAALQVLEQRRFGRVGDDIETHPRDGHISIVNVFTSSPELERVVNAPRIVEQVVPTNGTPRVGERNAALLAQPRPSNGNGSS